MKRDLDLIRKILLAMEAEDCGFPESELQIEGFTEEQIGFHVHLLGQAGLARVVDSTYLENLSPSAIPTSITWAGYEFLAASKDDTLWDTGKAKVIKPTGGVAFGVLVDWLKAEAKAKLGIPI